MKYKVIKINVMINLVTVILHLLKLCKPNGDQQSPKNEVIWPILQLLYKLGGGA